MIINLMKKKTCRLPNQYHVLKGDLLKGVIMKTKSYFLKVKMPFIFFKVLKT